MKKHQAPQTASVVRAIGSVTFQEIIRDKILYNTLLCAFFLMGISLLASRLTFVRPDRVITDFGIAALGISCSLIAILVGAPLIGREFERRTVFVALSKPISQFQFLLGKYSGLAAVIVANGVLLSLLYVAILLIVGGTLSGTLFLAVVLVFAKALLMGALAFLFSSFTTTSLSVIFSLGLYLLGNNISQILFLANKIENPVSHYLLKFIARLLPNLEFFHLGTQLTYALPVSPLVFLGAIFYALLWIGVSIAAACFLIQRREI